MRRLALAIIFAAVSGCTMLASPPPQKADFDFGPLPPGYASHELEARVVVYDISAPAWMDTSAMYYRLAYQNAANPMPYAQSQWVMSPAALLTQRLRSTLTPTSFSEAVRASADGPRAYALHAELVEFAQVFDRPDYSRGVLRLRATLEGNGVWMQRTFAIDKPAATTDAAGGIKALIECSDELAAQISAWVAGGVYANRQA